MDDTDKAAKRAVELEEENDYSLRVAATHASRETGMVRHQTTIYNRAKDIQ